ncbi:hypothetical protein [Comamonas sp.]|uniref:hypothetical protein n=1 Tax=Comamonas sp. TaxID=34028 RepID=UPI003D145EB7
MKIAPKAFNKFRLYRQRRFWTISFIKYWWRSVAVLAVAYSVSQSSKPVEYWIRPIYLLLALGFLWTDTYFNVEDLKRKWEGNQRRRKRQRIYREMEERLAQLERPPTS